MARALEAAFSRAGLSSTLELPIVSGDRQEWQFLLPLARCLYVGVYPGERAGSLLPPSGGGTDPDSFVPMAQTPVQHFHPFWSPLELYALSRVLEGAWEFAPTSPHVFCGF